MDKIKASQNKAAQVETKPPLPPKTIETMTSEELGLALPQQYQTLGQVQQNIRMIAQELEKRKQRHDEAERKSNNDTGKT